MKKLLLLAIAIIPLLLSCKKSKSDLEPESKGIPLFDLTVYD